LIGSSVIGLLSMGARAIWVLLGPLSPRVAGALNLVPRQLLCEGNFPFFRVFARKSLDRTGIY
jgi:hypothetical protein